jgi:hypothetical protein
MHMAELAGLGNFNYKIHRIVNSALSGAPNICSNGSLACQRLADVVAIRWGTRMSGATPENEVGQSDHRPTVADQISVVHRTVRWCTGLSGATTDRATFRLPYREATTHRPLGAIKVAH